MSNNRITPFVKRMRANGGTIYTFSSAVEDIGLNINERNNQVKISHFALLDIPNIAESSIGYFNNTFNIRNIAGCWEYERNSTSIKDGRVLIAESFQNYALNLESNLLNRDSSGGVGYNPALSRTVSERVFWKWLKETGSIRWTLDTSISSGIQYWAEELDTGGDYTTVVKYVGQVSAGNVRIDSFGTYNETYVLVPTSHGQTSAYFRQIEDDNYFHGLQIGDLGENILGREGYTKPHPDGLSMRGYYDFIDSSTRLLGGTEYYLQYDPSAGSWYQGWWYSAYNVNPAASYTDNVYLIDSSSYKTTGIYHTDLRFVPTGGGNNITFRRSNVDCISLELDLNNLTDVYKKQDPTLDQLTWDKAAIEYAVDDAFNFNTVLIYYTVYTQTGEVLATNLLGAMFLDAPSGNSSDITTSGIGIQLPSLEKIMSGPTGFGTSYSLRLNIKTDNMLDDTTATIVDHSTSDQLWAEDWTEAFANLDKAVNILSQQNNTINYISGQYVVLQGNQSQIENQVLALQEQVNDIGRDIQGESGTIALFSDGDDPLVESSIYMRYGRVGIFTQDPQYALHVDGSIKSKDITIENAIRDTSGNVILGYGSPLRLGSSTNYREIELFTGNSVAALQIDTSNHVNINGDTSILGQIGFDASVTFNKNVKFEGTLESDYFDFNTSYVRDTSAGTGLVWQNGFLNATGDVSILGDGSTGSIQFINSQNSLVGDPSFFWNNDIKRLGINLKDGLNTYGTVSILQQGDTYEDGLFLIAEGQTSFRSYVDSNDRACLSRDNSTFIRAGANGDVSIYNNLNVEDLTASSLKIAGNLILPGISSGTTSYVLYYNPTTDVVLYGSQYITSYTGGSNNRVITSTGAAGINAEANLTFDGTNLNLSGNLDATGSLTAPFYLSDASCKMFTTTLNTGVIWDSASQRIGINDDTPSYTLQIGGTLAANLTADSSLTDIVYYNTSTKQLTYGTNPSSIVTTYNGAVDNRVLTSGGSGIINGEANLTFDGNNLYLGDGADKYIAIADVSSDTTYTLNVEGQTGNSTNPTGGNLDMKAGDGNTVSGSGNSTGGDVNIYGGDGNQFYGATGNGYGGNIVLRGGLGTSSQIGNIYLACTTAISTTLGQALYGNSNTPTSPVISFAGDSGTGLYRVSSGQIGVATSGVYNFLFDSSTFHARGNIISYSGIFSDKRLKTNIIPLQNSLNKVLNLRGIEYDDIDGGGHHLGFIAQEVENIMPEVVIESTPLGKDNKYKAVKYTEIIPHLVEAIKQQQDKIEKLEKEIKELKKS